VDRVQLGKQVTGDPTALRRLEEIVHPLVRNAERKFLRDAEIAGAPIVVLDVPLLFETGGDSRVDATVVVSASAEMQRERVLERGVSLERLEALLGRQMPDAEKRRRADFVVDSGQGVEHARAQVRQILAAVAKMPTRRK
jgi:dephospho-CoA kinase